MGRAGGEWISRVGQWAAGRASLARRHALGLRHGEARAGRGLSRVPAAPPAAARRGLRHWGPPGRSGSAAGKPAAVTLVGVCGGGPRARSRPRKPLAGRRARARQGLCNARHASGGVSASRDVLHLVSAKTTRMVIEEPGGRITRVSVDIEEFTKSHEGTSMDEELEPIENEVGTFLMLYCHGDPAVRRFLYSRSIIDSRTFAPREFEWVIECGEGEEARTVAFLGRLYNYDERTVIEGKDIEMKGRIRVAD